MTPEQRRELRMKLKRTKWANKSKTGKNPTKKEMNEAYTHIVKTILPYEPKENWKPSYSEPIGIKYILKGMLDGKDGK
jgi:hypothetical protein